MLILTTGGLRFFKRRDGEAERNAESLLHLYSARLPVSPPLRLKNRKPPDVLVYLTIHPPEPGVMVTQAFKTYSLPIGVYSDETFRVVARVGNRFWCPVGTYQEVVGGTFFGHASR